MSEQPKDGGQAFPMPMAHEYGYEGMSLRDWFAGMAMQGMCAANRRFDDNGAHISEWMPADAYAIADAMLAERREEAQ